ncbi:MAG TPA: hypothetical protein PKK56_01295 [archaeon]|jgi:cytochrome c biogenesis protein CcdA|nr:hypothetical protein [archaeon]
MAKKSILKQLPIFKKNWYTEVFTKEYFKKHTTFSCMLLVIGFLIVYSFIILLFNFSLQTFIQFILKVIAVILLLIIIKTFIES